MPPKDKKDAKGKDAKDAKGKDAKDDKKGGKAPRGGRGAPDRGRGRGAAERGRGRRGDKKEGEGEDRGGFGRGFGGRRGRGRRGGRRGGAGTEKVEWTPLTKLGRLVNAKKIKSLEEIYLFSLPIKEHQIIDYFLGDTLKDEVMKISPVQKQSAAGQRTRFRAFVIVGDENGHIGLGNKVSKEVATAIRGAIIDAKLHVMPVRRGYWGGRLGNPHTVPCKVQGKCGSVRFRIIPAPRGTGLVAARVPRKVLTYAGIKDCFTASTGQSKTLGNFGKATIDALRKTYGYLTPDLWRETAFEKSPYQEHTDWLKDAQSKKKVVAGQA